MANLTRDIINIEDEIQKIEGLEASAGATPPMQEFVFTANGIQTVFILQLGWKPLAVYSNGTRVANGAAYNYVVTFDGFNYSVVFTVAPANTTLVLIDAWRPL
jgi:hypothetical protein